MASSTELAPAHRTIDIAPLANPASSWRGRCVNIIYLPLLGGIFITAIGAAYSSGSGDSSLYTTAFILSGVSLVIALILIYKYGDVSRITSRIEATTQNLTNQVHQLTQDNAQLTRENSELKGTVEALENNNVQLNQSLKDLDQTIENLKASNVQLTEKIAQLEQLIGMIQDKTAELRERNNSFEAEIQEISAKVPSLNQINQSLQYVGNNLKSQIENELGELDRQSQKIQVFSKQLIQTLQKQTQDLQAQLQSLHLEEDVYAKDNTQLAARVQSLEALSESANKTDDFLKTLSQKLEADLASLKQEQEQFAKEKEEFLAGIGRDRNQLNQQTLLLERERRLFETLQDSLTQTVHDQQEVNREIEAQLKDLDS